MAADFERAGISQVNSSRICPLCGGDSCADVVERRAVPAMLNRFYDSADAARRAPVGRLAVVVCENCGFVFNHAFDPGLVVYDAAYENDQSLSPTFMAHMSAMAQRVVAYARERPDSTVVETGCGQGRFLQMLAAQGRGVIRNAIGYDPAWRGGGLAEGVRIEPRRFDAAAIRSSAASVDAIVSRHLIEHVADPVGFLRETRAVLPQSWGGRLFVETPNIDWILDGGVMHDFFYEHCNYFSADTLSFALGRAGFRVEKIEFVAAGQYIWAEAVAGTSPPVAPGAANAVARATAMRGREGAFNAAWQVRLARSGGAEKIAVWGAGAKGVTFVGMMNRDREPIACLIDINPAKQGKYTPVEACPVVSPSQAAALGVTMIVVMNPNYRAEIEASLKPSSAKVVIADAGSP